MQMNWLLSNTNKIVKIVGGVLMKFYIVLFLSGSVKQEKNIWNLWNTTPRVLKLNH